MLQPNPYTITLCEPVNALFYENVNELIDYILDTTDIVNINLYDIEIDDTQELYYITYINQDDVKEYTSIILINKVNNKGEVTLNEETIYFITE